MAHVYSNSYCTIAASTAENSDHGCLQRRTLAIQACTLSWPEINSQGPGLSVTIYPEKLVPKKFLAKCALAQRGWTLQEMELSHRTLHYTDSGLLWTCNKMEASEQDPGIDSVKPDLFAEVYERMDVEYEPAKPWKNWRRIVEQFSRRSLTNVTDRLPALAGLASQMKEETKDTYLAGMWKADLVHDLTWSRGYDMPPLTPSPTYIAPSWSWASCLGAVKPCTFEIGAMRPISGDKSLDGLVLARATERASKEMRTDTSWNEILRNYEQEAAVLTILNVGVTTKGANPFGEISGGFLEAQGKVRKARMLNRNQGIACFGDGPPSLESVAGQFILPLLDLKTGNESQVDQVIGCCAPDFEVESESPEEIVSCLYVSPNTLSLYSRRETSGIALILRPSGSQENKYERVGLADIQTGKWFDDCKKTVITII